MAPAITSARVEKDMGQSWFLNLKQLGIRPKTIDDCRE
jgi:hypothetical protein